VTAAVVLLLIGVGGYAFVWDLVGRGVQQVLGSASNVGNIVQAKLKWETAEAEAKRKADEAERQRLAGHAAKVEQQRLAAAKAEQERQARAAAPAQEIVASHKREAAGMENPTLCLWALDAPKSGWDQTKYGTYGTEASRRGLTVDSCRQLVGANSLFLIRRDMEASRVLEGFSHDVAYYSLSVEECEQKCAQRSNCNVFTYNKRGGSAGACYLYTRGRAQLTSNPDFDSGIRNTESSALPTTTASNSLFTIRRGIEASYVSGLNEAFDRTSFEECQQKCAQQQTCNVFTYTPAGTACYLYSRAELKRNTNYDSGIRN
jgi:hypothetical protein